MTMPRLISFALRTSAAFCGLVLASQHSHGVDRLEHASNRDAPRPNILYFYVDDMGWGSIGPNGQAERRAQGLPNVRTPNIDRLAAKGVNFRRGYACHVCSPSRASQQTGFHQGHAYADRNDPNNARKAIRADDVTIGDALSAAGYTTGYWGKWGYGGSKELKAPTIENVQTLPTSHGYQHVLAELHHVRAHTFFQPTLWHAPAPKGAIGGVQLIPNTVVHTRNNDAYPQQPAIQNHPDYPDTAYCDDSYAFAALDFVKAQALNYNRTKQPFIGILAAQIPHAPFAEISKLPEWDAAYRNDPHFKTLSPQSQQWAAMVTRIDAHFGNILAALRDPNGDGDESDSIEDNTLVIFQSDNGGPSGKNNVELDANGGLLGNKGTIHEGGIRVPLVMRWPAEIHGQSTLKAGTNSDRVVDITDLLPTFCELAGTVPPVGIDGVSIAPLLTGRGYQRNREFVIHESGRASSIIRGDHKLTRTNKGELALFDLAGDHHEDTNLAARHPALVKELEAKLIAERVLEPKGFAVTYHTWEGGETGSAKTDESWSDYEYANAGITYTATAGTPEASWITRITGPTPATCRIDSKTEMLALEVGSPSAKSPQKLIVDNDGTLVARNEVRITANGSITINGGWLSVGRWIDVHSQGQLSGHGRIRGDVINAGLVESPGGNSDLKIRGEFVQTAAGRLHATVGNSKQPGLRIHGTAQLAGALSVALHADYAPKRGERFVILTADQIEGRFQDDEVVAIGHSADDNAPSFRIRYNDTTVELEAR